MRQDYAVELNRFRAGPWPGLTPTGALVLLACAALLGVLLATVGPPSRAWPDLAIVAARSVIPVALATSLVRTPGVAAGTTGVYLLISSLASLLTPAVALPPLLLAPALAFDLIAWLRLSDLRAARDAWPRRAKGWPRKRGRTSRHLTWPRLALAGAAFGALVCAVEPAWSVLLGADPEGWGAEETLRAVVVATVACAALSVAAHLRPPAARAR